MFVFCLAFRNIISRKSSLVIILFIAFTIALLAVSNAVFDGTSNGIRAMFSASFTGDIVVRPKADFPLSLFGDETPATGMLSDIPLLFPYTGIYTAVKGTENIETVTPQLTGQAVMNCNTKHIPLILFGVDASNYLHIMKGITILQGSIWSDSEKGLMLSTAVLDSIQKQSGIRLKCGDHIQLLSGTGTSFTMRSVPVSAVYRYPADSEVLGRIALISPEVLRELTGLTTADAVPQKIEYSQENLLDSMTTNIDDLFDNSGQTARSNNSSADLPGNEKRLIPGFAGAWNFLICTVVPGSSIQRAISRMNRTFRKNGWPVQAVNWRTAAGISAQYMYWLRLIFNIGIIVILGTGFIVVNNTLVISALDRTQEMGTIRAIGAGRDFVAVEFLLETGMLTICAGLIGCLLGTGATALINRMHITFRNMYLIQLFGGPVLETYVTAENLIRCMGLSVFLTCIGWLHPAHIALSVSPSEAMQGVH